MQNQFLYTRREIIKGEEGTPDRFLDLKDTFNINKVIRAVAQNNGELIILLDDIHERVTDVPVFDHKNNRIKSYKKERGVFQSEIVISSKEDVERYYKATSID